MDERHLKEKDRKMWTISESGLDNDSVSQNVMLAKNCDQNLDDSLQEKQRVWALSNAHLLRRAM